MYDDNEWQRQETEDRARRFAARVEEQRRLHELDPEKHSLLVPVDDEEFGTEVYTAGWRDEEPEDGYEDWDDDSDERETVLQTVTATGGRFCASCTHGLGFHSAERGCLTCHRISGGADVCMTFTRRLPLTRHLAKPRIGPRMRAIADYVSAVPGCSKAEALRGAELPEGGMGYTRPMNRTIEAGLVLVDKVAPNRCRLFSDETARELFYLRDELFHGDPTAERADEILAQAEVLRARQAAEYAQAQPEASR